MVSGADLSAGVLISALIGISLLHTKKTCLLCCAGAYLEQLDDCWGDVQVPYPFGFICRLGGSKTLPWVSSWVLRVGLVQYSTVREPLCITFSRIRAFPRTRHRITSAGPRWHWVSFSSHTSLPIQQVLSGQSGGTSPTRSLRAKQCYSHPLHSFGQPQLSAHLFKCATIKSTLCQKAV